MHHYNNQINNGNQIVFDQDPFNHIDVFSFSDFDGGQTSNEMHHLPTSGQIESLRPHPGHMAFINPTLFNGNEIESQYQIAMKLGLTNNTSPSNSPSFNENRKGNNKSTTKKILTKAEKKMETKKRGRKSSEEKADSSEDHGSVKLPQKFSYLEEKEKYGTLTEEEEKILKKERRLIKNRESAQQFRKRQKQHTMDLQERVNHLTDENTNLKHQLENINKEKQHLEKQISNLWGFVNKAFTFAVPYRVERN